jgi:hypothetical protein
METEFAFQFFYISFHLVFNLSLINLFQARQSYLRSISILFLHLSLVLLRGLFIRGSNLKHSRYLA